MKLFRRPRAWFEHRFLWRGTGVAAFDDPFTHFLPTTDTDRLQAFFRDLREENFPPLEDAEDSLEGHCYVCQAPVRFSIDRHDGDVNWRESMRCERCGLINRWRSSFHLFEKLCLPHKDSEIFMTEAVTPLFDLILARYGKTTGSEFSPAASPGELISLGGRTVEMQDVTRLTHPASRFDCVLSFDVLEHVPHYEAALGEFHRVLKPGGLLLLSVPFTFDDTTLIRAVINDQGEIEHHLPPEYHGDPVSDGGVLCFQTFGMDLLQQLKRHGFLVATACCFASRYWGYLGENMLFVARKSPRART
ncbi:MAG: class I SAM-dependent methyltransferase [Gammaproteobacteria bacterium]